MGTKKVTFTLDEATLASLARAARRLDQPKSRVVRDAIREYGERIGKLSEAERLRLLRVFDEVVPRIPERSVEEVETELRAIRAARRGGGRRSPTDG
jgi:hypothetical protein